MIVLMGVLAMTHVSAEQVDLVCPRLDGEIVVDGRLDEPGWEEAAPAGPLVMIETGMAPDQRTTLMVAHDGRRLLVGVRCEGAPEGVEPLPRDDGGVWRRDHLELFLDATPDAPDYVHLVVDSAGSLFDARRDPGADDDEREAWDAEIEAAAATGEEGWTTEIAVPFDALGAAPQPGDLWRFKLGRDGGPTGPIMWPGNPTSSFHSRVADAALYFERMNLLPNGDFERGELGDDAPEGWHAHLTSSEVDNAYQGDVQTVEGGLEPGRQALRVTKVPEALWWPQVWSDGMSLQPGGTYELSMAMGGSLQQVNLRATFICEGEPVKISEGRRPGEEQFVRRSLAFIVPEAADETRVGIAAPDDVFGEVVLDNAVLRRMLAAEDAVERQYYAPDWSPDPDPVHGLHALVERAGHKPWELFERDGGLLTHRVIFHDRERGTELWLLDDSPGREYVVTASIWPGWNADCSVLMLPGGRVLGGETIKHWQCNRDFSRLTPMPTGGMPLWDLQDPDIYYVHSRGKVERANLRTGEVTELASWEPRDAYEGVTQERSYGLTGDNEAVFVVDYDGGEWLPWEPTAEPLPPVRVLDCYGPHPDGEGRLSARGMVTETESGPKIRVIIGRRVDTQTGQVEHVVLPVSGRREYLEVFASGRIQFPDGVAVPDTSDLRELFELYHLTPSCSHGHLSYSPDSSYTCWDGSPSFYRTWDGEDRHDVDISPNGSCYHTCWFHDPRFFVTGVRPYRRSYDRPVNANLLCQVFTDGTWQPVADMKTRFNAFYYGGNFATLSRDATKIHYESSMTGVPHNYIAVMARPQPPRDVSWSAEDGAVELRWSPPPHHAEIRGYLVYRSEHSGRGYELLTPEPVAGTSWRDESVQAGRAHFYVVTSLEHCGLESGYSAEAALAGIDVPDEDPALVIYAEAERGLVDLPSAAKPGLSRGRDRLGASNWYYLYRTPGVTHGAASVPVRTARAAPWQVWLRVRLGEGEVGRWSVTFDGRQRLTAAADAHEWQWVRAGEVELDEGEHRLELATPDGAAQLDVLCLATDAQFAPDGPRPEDETAPEAVAELHAELAGHRAVRLLWTAADAPDLAHYNVYAAREADVAAQQRFLIGSPTYPEFIDWGLRADAEYGYVVTAVDRRGHESEPSPVAVARTAVPEQPLVEMELLFAEAELAGQFEQFEAEGTHGDVCVLLAEEDHDASATWRVDVPHGGEYYLWLRYLPRGAASSRGAAVEQNVQVLLDAEPIASLGGGLTDLSCPDGIIRPEFWTWARPVGVDLRSVHLPAGTHELRLRRLTPQVRYDSLLITSDPAFQPSDGRLRQR